MSFNENEKASISSFHVWVPSRSIFFRTMLCYEDAYYSILFPTPTTLRAASSTLCMGCYSIADDCNELLYSPLSIGQVPQLVLLIRDENFSRDEKFVYEKFLARNFSYYETDEKYVFYGKMERLLKEFEALWNVLEHILEH